jgi:hypothetical protein
MPRTKQTSKKSTGGIAPRKTDKTDTTAPASTPAVRLVVSSDSATPLPAPPSDGKNDVRAYLLKCFSLVSWPSQSFATFAWMVDCSWSVSTVQGPSADHVWTSTPIRLWHLPSSSARHATNRILKAVIVSPTMWVYYLYSTTLIVTKTNYRLRPSMSWMVLHMSTTPSIPLLISLRSRLLSKSLADFKCMPTPRCPMTPFWSSTLCYLGHLIPERLLMSLLPTCQDFLPSLLSGLLRWNSILRMIQVWNRMQSGLHKFAANTSRFIPTP